MSRLILKGNTLSNTGEYFPSVYIDKIYLNDHGISVDASVFVPHKDDVNIYDDSSAPAASSADEQVYVEEMNTELYYYVAFLLSTEAEDYTYEPWMGSETEYYSGQNLYQYILEGKINIADTLEVYSTSRTSTTMMMGTSQGRHTHLILCKVEPFSSTVTPITIFDENGQEYLKYMDTKSAYIDFEFSYNPVLFWDWEDINSLQVLAFSSTIELDQATYDDLVEETKDPVLVQKKIGDISYEPVWSDYTLASRLQVEYVDASGAIYDQIPLQAINTLYYKINRITHEEIVDSIDSLVTQFREDYKLDEIEERKHPALRSAIDAVSTVLELYGYDVSIVPRLNAVRSTFVEKSLHMPVGKFYKHLRRRLFNIDKLIRLGQRLRKKVMYNGKIIDQRTVETSLDVDGSYIEHEGCDLLYRDWMKTSTYLYDWTGDDEEWKKLVYNGYYMFDYEKSLRENSILSRYLNVHALEEAGIHIPYRHYRVEQSYVDRESDVGIIEWEDGEAVGSNLAVDVRLRALMKENVPYPITEKMYVSDSGIMDDNSVNPNAAGEPYVSALSCTFLEGTWSHLMNRRFVDVSADSIETETGIQDYRLLAFELMDFSNAVVASGNDVYTATVSIEDNSMQFFAALENMIGWINAEYHGYLTRCQQLCAANNTTNLFNAFFSESIMEEYEGNMNAAPWIRCPLFLLSIQHIVTGQWANRQEIIERAAIIVSQINPVNGNLTAVQAFWDDLQALKDDLLVKIKDAADADNYYNGGEGANWYDVEETKEYSCELNTADNSVYNDEKGLYPMETSECDDLHEPGVSSVPDDTEGESSSTGFRWVLESVVYESDYGKKINNSDAKELAQELASSYFEGNFSSRTSTGAAQNEEWWKYDCGYPTYAGDECDYDDIKEKVQMIDYNAAGATTWDGRVYSVNLIDHFQHLSSESAVDDHKAGGGCTHGSGHVVCRNEYLWYRFVWWGGYSDESSGFGVLEYKCYYGNDPSTECGLPDTKITSEARENTYWDGDLDSSIFEDSGGMDRLYEAGKGVIDVDREY